MKLTKFCIIIIAGSIGLVSCGSADTTPNSTSNSNRASDAEPQSYVDNNGQGEPANTTELAEANVDTAANRRAKKLEEMRAAANNQPQDAVPVNTRPAPEDSEITTTLTDVAREVRVWKKNPTLAKIEKVYDGQNVSIKVYLRNGRVFDLPGSSIAQLEQIPSATVLTLVGVGSNPQKPSASSQKEVPKKVSN